MSLHSRLVDEIDVKKADFDLVRDPVRLQELRTRVEAKILTLLEEEGRQIRDRQVRRRIVKSVLDEALGLGPLEDLLQDPSITEIMVNRHDQIYVEKAGKLTLSDAKFMGPEQVRGVIERIVAPLGRRIDEKVPMVDARLADGSRVNAIIPPLALRGPAITIRKFSKKLLGTKDLIEFGSLTDADGHAARGGRESRQNIVISGGTGSGKTTLLNVLSSFIPADERIVTVEDAAELQLPQDHVVSLETRPPNIEGEGAITIRDLVRNALRMRPDRIVVGECRGGEALDMLQAMNTGHDGSLTTVHANTPRDALSRLETLALMSGLELPARAIRDQIASAIQIIIQQSRLQDGTRRVTHITALTGQEESVFTTADIFVFQQLGLSPEGKVQGRYVPTGFIPPFIEGLARRGIQGAARDLPAAVGVAMIARQVRSRLLLAGVAAVPRRRGPCAGVLGERWTRRVGGYGTWVADELDKVFIEVATGTRRVRGSRSLVVGAARARPDHRGHTWRSGCSGRRSSAAPPTTLPTVVVHWLQARYLQKVDDQLVDSLRMMANALKAGLNLQQAIELVTREMPDPIAEVFGRVVREIGLGRLTDDALRRMAARVPLEDVRLFTDSVLTLRETGGNLSETFGVIAETVVERKKVQGRIKTLTTQGISQGVIICSMPVVMMLVFTFIDDHYLDPFFQTPLGWLMLFAGVHARRGRHVGHPQAGEGGGLSAPGARGQTTTEYLMIAGLITAIFLALYPADGAGLVKQLQRVAECVLNDECP